MFKIWYVIALYDHYMLAQNTIYSVMITDIYQMLAQCVFAPSALSPPVSH